MAGEDYVVQCIVDLINSAEEAVTKPGFLQLNKSLNLYLLERLLETRRFLQTEAVHKFRERIAEPLKALHRIVTDADSIVQECCRLPWIPAAIRQADNKEAFFEVVRDLHWCTGVVKTATLQALHESGRDSISDLEVALVVEHSSPKSADAEEELIRKKVDAAATMDMIALESKLNHFILDSQTDEADHDRAEHLAIAKHLQSWFRANLEGHESSGNLTGILQQGEKIGKGASGYVFKCTWHGLTFAEKGFYAEGDSGTNFKEEAKVMRDIRHPNVVKLVAKDDARCKLVLELMDGSLTELITERAPFRLVETVDILLQISKAMLFLHGKRVAHRDIKSGNILYNIGPEPEGYIHVKVADFGLAKLKLKSMIAMTVNKGTREWTAPELIKISGANDRNIAVDSEGKQTVTVEHALRSADVYSFGITCFEVATGQTNPYRKGDVARPPNLAYKVAVEGLRPQIPDDVPKELKYLMQICWSQDPSCRPPFTYIYKFLRDFKASLLTDPNSPFCYEEWKGDRWSNWWSNFLGTLARASGVVWGGLCVAMVWAISTVKLLFTKRFKSLEEITDRDVRSLQIPYQALEAATVGKIVRHVRLSKDVEVTVTKTNALSEKVFLKGAFFLTQIEAHPNLPRLIGYSVHDNSFYLVHKADSVNVVGSLHDVRGLSADGDWKVRHALTWVQRYNIALGVGQALACLHQLSVPIIHGNLSSKNIMLEKGTYNPKLFNFYTSCMFPDSGSFIPNFPTTDTRGWDAPEKEAVRGDKTAFAQDVYSFGILLLVLVTDRNAFTASNTRMHVHIVDEAWKYLDAGRLRDLEGSEVNGDRDVVLRVLKLALHCVQTDAHKRPKMAEAVDMLTGKIEMKDTELAMHRRSSLTPKTTNDQRLEPSSSRAITRRNVSDVSEKVGKGHVKQS